MNFDPVAAAIRGRDQLFGLRFRAKLMIAVVLAVGLVAAFFTFYFPLAERGTAEHALRARAQVLTGVLAGVLEATSEPTPADVFRLVGPHTADSDLRYLVVVRGDGGIVASYRKAGVEPSAERRVTVQAPETINVAGLIHASAPIYSHDGTVIATLTAGFSKQAIDAAAEQSQRTALLLGAAILIGALLISWLITRPLVTTARELTRLSGDLSGNAREQEATATQESAAVEETRRSMEMLLASAEEIARRSSEVLGNSERSTAHSREIAQRIEQLGAMLHSIEQIADKTDLLALNAALEGTRAGEAGKGFTLVADEMRRLAENVIATAARIREIMGEMHKASEQAVQASQVGTASSEKIALLTQEQRQATEAVVTSMEEMRDVLARTVRGIQRSNEMAQTIGTVAQVMAGMLDDRPKNAARRAAAAAPKPDKPVAAPKVG